MKYSINSSAEYQEFQAGLKSGLYSIIRKEAGEIFLSDGDSLIIKEGIGEIKKNYNIITRTEQFTEAFEHLQDHEIIAFDTETTGLNVRKDKIIGFSFSGKVGTGYYLPMYIYNPKIGEIEKTEVYKYWPDLMEIMEYKKLVMWNGSYDISIVKNDMKIDLTNSLYCEVMLLKHAVDEVPPFGLKPTSVKYQEELGLDMESAANEEQIKLKENVKKNGGETTAKNYEMYKADLEVMGPYACADADLTLRLFELFSGKLKAEGLEEFFYEKEIMPLYKNVTIGMDNFGVNLDINLMSKTLVEIIEDIKILKAEVIAEILDPEVGGKWFLDYVAGKLPPKKGGKFGQYVVKFYGLDLPLTKSGKFSITKKSLEGLGGFPAEFLRTGEVSYIEEDLEQIQSELWDLDNEERINISSKPQMSDLVFNYMGIKPLSLTLKAKKPQFNNELIESLEADHKWAKLLGNYNKLTKIKGAYIERFLDNHDEGKYYFYYKQHGTISGRFSSDAQQLPRPKEEGELDPIVLKYNNLIRSFFIANPGKVFIDADYESLEPHVFAHVSGDEGLRDIFRKGHDFYSTIAIKTEKMDGISADKKADNYLGKVNKPARQTAKAYCLGIPYGMEGYALGKSLEVPQKEAEKLIRGYLDGFPKLKEWMATSNIHAQVEGYVQSEIGRIRHLPEVKELYAKYENKLKNWKFRKSLEKTMDREDIDKMKSQYKNGLNNAKNFQIQSLGASIVNIAMIKINKYLTDHDIDGKVICTVHDQIICEVPEELAKELAPEIERIMADCYKLSIKLKAPAEIGYNWRDTH